MNVSFNKNIFEEHFKNMDYTFCVTILRNEIIDILTQKIQAKNPDFKYSTITVLQKNCFKYLSEKEQEIVSLKILSGLSFKEIANILNMPIATVQWRYYKALHTLKILTGNLSMFIVAITIFLANKTIFKERKKVANEEVKPEEQDEEYRKDETSTKKENNNLQESTSKQTDDIKENLRLENVMLGDNTTNNELKEQINQEGMQNLNKIDIGILSVSGIFLTISIIFSIIFVKHQQKRRKKVSK